MDIGRELDSLIAEKILGLQVIKNKKGGWSIGKPDWYWERFEGTVLNNPLPEYSENIVEAFKVVEAVKHLGWYFHLDNYAGGGMKYMCIFQPDEDMLPNQLDARGIAETPAHAICLAVLKTKE